MPLSRMRKWSSLLNKTDLRKVIRAKREAVSSAERENASNAAAEIFKNHIFFRDMNSIAGYFATPEEFDCRPIMEMIWQLNKKCYLPVLSETKENYLEFALYRNNDNLKIIATVFWSLKQNNF